MLAQRRAFDTDALATDIAKLRDACMGCRNCKGARYELLQLAQLPKVLLERRGART